MSSYIQLAVNTGKEEYLNGLVDGKSVLEIIFSIYDGKS